MTVKIAACGVTDSSSPSLASNEQLLQMLQDHDAFIFDCDGAHQRWLLPGPLQQAFIALTCAQQHIINAPGTLWQGNTLIDGANAALTMLRQLGKKVIFVTNSSMRSRSSFLAKFVQLGVQASLSEIYCSSYATVAYLESAGFDKGKQKVYVVGERGILDELQEAGYQCLGGAQDDSAAVSFRAEVQVDPQVGAVVCGVDFALNYYKICYASLCLQHNPGCLFVVTNTEPRGHFIATQEWPGAGATVGAIGAAAERVPVVTSKPAPFLLDEISRTHGVARERLLMVGDRLDTDVQWGLNTGMGTLLVMTGSTTMDMLQCSVVKPHYVMDSVADLLQASQLQTMCAAVKSAAAAELLEAEQLQV